jgi:hypothetical protein
MIKIKKSFILALTLILLSTNYTYSNPALNTSKVTDINKASSSTNATSSYLYYTTTTTHTTDNYIPASLYVVYPYQGIGYKGTVYLQSVTTSDHLYYAHYAGYIYPSN